MAAPVSAGAPAAGSSSEPSPKDDAWKQWEVEWGSVQAEVLKLEELHRTRQRLVKEMVESERKVMKDLAALTKQVSEMKSDVLGNKRLADTQGKACIQAVADAESKLAGIRDDYPIESKMMLRTLLGTVNVRLSNSTDRFQYKQEYETWKLKITYIIIAVSALIIGLGSCRWLESVFHFLLVWFYFIGTVREHVLIQNGSKIKKWWRYHHYMAIIVSAVMLTWPVGETYHQFHPQFMQFSLLLGVVQLMQYRYQSAALYKKIALGKTDQMATTSDVAADGLDGALTVMVTLLVICYMFQLYNAYTLAVMYMTNPNAEWQVLVVGAIMFVFGCCNSFTTLKVMQNKFKKTFTTSAAPVIKVKSR